MSVNMKDEDLITCLWCQQSTPHQTAMGACCWKGKFNESALLRGTLERILYHTDPNMAPGTPAPDPAWIHAVAKSALRLA